MAKKSFTQDYSLSLISNAVVLFIFQHKMNFIALQKDVKESLDDIKLKPQNNFWYTRNPSWLCFFFYFRFLCRADFKAVWIQQVCEVSLFSIYTIILIQGCVDQFNTENCELRRRGRFCRPILAFCSKG